MRVGAAAALRRDPSVGMHETSGYGPLDDRSASSLGLSAPSSARAKESRAMAERDLRSTRDEDFSNFLVAQAPSLIRLGLWITGDSAHAEDLVQEAATRAYTKWTRIAQDDPAAYLRRTMLNLYRDAWRRRLRENRWAAAATNPVSDDASATLQSRDQLRRALLTLTVKERMVVVLRHYLDMSEAHVAYELRMAKGTVKSTNARALGKLRDILLLEPR